MENDLLQNNEVYQTKQWPTISAKKCCYALNVLLSKNHLVSKSPGAWAYLQTLY
jgi:hypothetical protein